MVETDLAAVSGRHRALAIAGVLLMLAAGFLVFASLLVAPPWGVAVLWVAWISTAVWAIRTWRRQAFRVLVAGAFVTVFWVGFVLFGDVVLGWTA